MGKQIAFYQTKEDEQEFVTYVRTTGDVVILAQTSEKELEEFQFFYELAGRKFGEGCHLWNRSVSAKPVFEHYPQQGYYCVDFMQSEVVNVWRSKVTDQGLSTGRLHIEDNVLTADGRLRSKGEPFLRWYSALASWIRKRYRKLDGAKYIAPNAESLHQSGMQLTGHSF